jgi:predicted metal-dependent peptidase
VALAKANTGNTDGKARRRVRSEDLTDEQRAANDRFDLDRFLIHLMWKEPVYYKILQTAQIIKTRDLPTAGVAVQNARINLYWNPDFVASLPEKHVIGLLQHEAAHLIYRHCINFRQPHRVWNWATDLSINTSLPVDSLPAGGWIPGRNFTPLSAEELAEMTQEDIDWFNHIDQLVASFPPKMTSDWYFEQLMQDEKIKDMVDKQQQLSEMLQELLSMDEHGEDAGSDAPGDGEGQMSEGDKQVVQGVLAEAVAKAVREGERKGWGSISGEMQGIMKAMISNEVDWRSLLRQFTGRCRRANARSTYRRRGRKHRDHPGRTRSRTSRIAIFLDESGSMGDDDLALLAGELNNLSTFCEFDLFPFDTRVMEEHKVVWRKGMRVADMPRVLCGGTSFQCCVDFVHSRAQKGNYDGYLLLSDGGSDKPSNGRLRRGYILVPGTELFFEKDPSDIVITMTGKAA